MEEGGGAVRSANGSAMPALVGDTQYALDDFDDVFGRVLAEMDLSVQARSSVRVELDLLSMLASLVGEWV